MLDLNHDLRIQSIDLHFVIDDLNIASGFLCDDITIDNNRHLIFMSEIMKILLANALI